MRLITHGVMFNCHFSAVLYFRKLCPLMPLATGPIVIPVRLVKVWLHGSKTNSIPDYQLVNIILCDYNWQKLKTADNSIHI